jgi:hypothetical protein
VPGTLKPIHIQPRATCRSALEADEAEAIADELERLLELPKGSGSSERGALIWNLEQSLMLALASARQSWELEAAAGLAGRELKEHTGASHQLARLATRNRGMLERHGLGSLLARAEAQTHRDSRPRDILLYPGDEDASRPASKPANLATLELPETGRTILVSTRSSEVAITVRAASPPATLSIDWPLAIWGWLSGLCVAAIVAWKSEGRVRLIAGLCLLGAFWIWKLRPEPIGALAIAVAVFLTLQKVWKHRKMSPRARAPASG